MNHTLKKSLIVKTQFVSGKVKRDATLLIVEDFFQYLIKSGMQRVDIEDWMKEYFISDIAPAFEEAFADYDQIVSMSKAISSKMGHVPAILYRQSFEDQDGEDAFDLACLIVPVERNPYEEVTVYFMREASLKEFANLSASDYILQ